jgi:1-acyl-sn-glycerol-3-phosphate acyltransferase
MITLRSVLFAIVFYLNTAFFLVAGAPLLFTPRRWAMAGLTAHALTSIWWLRLICNVRLEVRGLEKLPKGAALIASKHQSAWDTFGLTPLLHDPAIIMKAELFRIPLYGWFSRKFKMIGVRREARGAALRAMLREARERAAAGRHVLIFPEGTRAAPGGPPDYKPGVLLLYEGLGLPCCPVALNTGMFWPRRSLRRNPGVMIVEVLDPIPPGLPRKEFSTRLQTAIEEATARLVHEAAAKSRSASAIMSVK